MNIPHTLYLVDTITMGKPQVDKILRIWKYLRAAGIITVAGEFSDKETQTPNLKEALEELMGSAYSFGHCDGQNAAEEEGLCLDDVDEEEFTRDPDKAWANSTLRAHFLRQLR
jgi:hypothetical protein